MINNKNKEKIYSELKAIGYIGDRDTKSQRKSLLNYKEKEKITDGKASGYFVMGNAIEGLKPVKIGDAEQETFTDGFAGEMKGTFTDIPVY